MKNKFEIVFPLRIVALHFRQRVNILITFREKATTSNDSIIEDNIGQQQLHVIKLRLLFPWFVSLLFTCCNGGLVVYFPLFHGNFGSPYKQR